MVREIALFFLARRTFVSFRLLAEGGYGRYGRQVHRKGTVVKVGGSTEG